MPIHQDILLTRRSERFLTCFRYHLDGHCRIKQVLMDGNGDEPPRRIIVGVPGGARP
jgi:hypothetical protein